MKQIFFTASILIFFGATWMLYLWWDHTRFVESLPKAPDRSSIENTTDLRSQQEPTVEDKNRDFLREAITQQDTPHVDEEVPIDTTHRPLHHGETHSPPRTATLHESERDIEVPKVESDPLFMPDLSAEELMESARQGFVEKHGNIPEIDIFFKYMAPVYEGWAAGGGPVVIDRTPEETVELSRAQMVLYPDKPHFRNQYQHALRTVEEIKRRRERLEK